MKKVCSLVFDVHSLWISIQICIRTYMYKGYFKQLGISRGICSPSIFPGTMYLLCYWITSMVPNVWHSHEVLIIQFNCTISMMCAGQTPADTSRVDSVVKLLCVILDLQWQRGSLQRDCMWH